MECDGFCGCFLPASRRGNCTLDTSTDYGIILIEMNIRLGHLSNYIKACAPSTAIRSIIEDAQLTGSSTPRRLEGRALAVRLPGETVEWLRQEAEAHGCAMAEVVRAHVAGQVVSELTALYQDNSASSTEFSAALWLALGYEPESSSGGEVM